MKTTTQPGSDGRARSRIALALTLAVGLLASFGVYRLLLDQETLQVRKKLVNLTEERVDHVNLAIDRSISSLHALAGLFYVRGEVSRDEFDSYVTNSLPPTHGVSRFQWQPLVPRSQRERFEAAARADGLRSFMFVEMQHGKLEPAQSREIHLPVYYEAPHLPEVTSLGLDLAWDPARLDTKLAARDRDAPIASRVYPLVGARSGLPSRPGFNISLPVYQRPHPPSVEQRRAQLRGFVASVISVREFLAPVVGGMVDRGIDVFVFDVSEQATPKLFYQQVSRGSDLAPLAVDAPYEPHEDDRSVLIRFGERKWRLVFHPTPVFLAAERSSQPALVLALGLFLTVLLAGHIYSDRRRRLQLESVNVRLRENEEHFRFLVEGTNVIAWHLDLATFRFTYVSPQAEAMLGYPVEQWREENFWIDSLHPEDRDYAVAYCDEYTRRGVDHRFEYRMRKADGDIVWLEDVVSVLKDELGRPQALRGIMIDISSRKAAEQTLRETAQRLNAVICNAPLAMFSVDRQGVFTLSDGRELGTLGGRPGSVVGQSIFDIYRDDRAMIEGVELALAGTSHNTLVQLRDQVFDAWFAPLHDASGMVIGALGVGLNITHRKRAEQQLAEVLELNRQIVSASPLGISAYRTAGECVLANEAAASLVGASVAQFLGKNFFELESWRVSGLLAAAKEALDIGRRVHRELLLTYLGRDRWLECDLAVFNSGGVAHLLLITHDITERKLAEQHLQEAEAKFRDLVEESMVGVCIIQDERFVYVNPKLAEMMGYTREELADSVNVFDTVDEASRPIVAETMRQRLQGEATSAHYEFVARRRDGTRVQVLVYGSRTVFNGRTAVIGTLLDVTQQKRTHDALQEQLHLIRQLLDAIPSPMYYKDAEGRYLGCNAAFEGALGVDRDDLIGKTVHDIQPRDLADLYYAADAELLDRLGTQTLEAEVQYADGARHSVLFYKATFFRTDGRLGGIVGVMLDITDRKRAEQDRLDLEAKLRQAQKMESIGHLSGGIAHDFNNILTTVVGYAELAQMTMPHGLDPRLELFLKEILLAANRARDLVAQLLTFSRAEDATESTINVGPAVQEVVKMLRSTFPATVSIVLEVDEQLPDARISAVQLHQVLMNLCINGRDAMDGQGRLDVRVYTGQIEAAMGCASCHRDFQGDFVVLAVRDEGHGISRNNLDKIFDPFFTTKEVGKGSGLGLSVLHGIVHASGGHVRVNSRPGQGCEFLIYLPAVSHTPAPARPAREAAPALPRVSARALVVDDETPIVSCVCELLESMGCEAIGITDPHAALQRFRDDPSAFDVLITDQTMPGLTGIELVQAVHRIRPDLPVVLCTGYSNAVNKENAVQFGIDRFLLKPVPTAVLAKTIEEVLSVRETQARVE